MKSKMLLKCTYLKFNLRRGGATHLYGDKEETIRLNNPQASSWIDVTYKSYRANLQWQQSYHPNKQ